MTNLTPLIIPELGVGSALIIELYLKVGQSIKKDDNLLMLETDKATLEVPSESAGIVKEILVSVGSKVKTGDVIGYLSTSNIFSNNTSGNIIAAAVTNESDNSAGSAAGANVYASPSIRKRARELVVDLRQIIGTGKNNRITEDDLQSYLNNTIINKQDSLQAVTQTGIQHTITQASDAVNTILSSEQFAQFGAIEHKTLGRIKKISGDNLARNWVMIPHVTQFDEADITELEEFRHSLNQKYKNEQIKITPLAFLMKAVSCILTIYPEFNASLVGEDLIYKKYYNIGFAVDTPQGLVVPVLKDVQSKGVVEISKQMAQLAALARDGKLKLTEMQGGTFTISSLGGVGGTAFTPIINAPEVAILGVSKSVIKPFWNGQQFVPKLMLPLSLSYDHRVIDGALAAKFTTHLGRVLADLRNLLL